MIRSYFALLVAALSVVAFVIFAPTIPLELRPGLAVLVLIVATIATVFALIVAQSPTRGAGHALRLGAIGDLTEKIRRALFDVVGAQYIGGARASLNYASIAAGLQERLTLTVTGALLGDFAQAACETDIEAGLAFVAHVSAADTVTVTMINNTAGAIDAAANVFRVRVTRESRR